MKSNTNFPVKILNSRIVNNGAKIQDMSKMFALFIRICGLVSAGAKGKIPFKWMFTKAKFAMSCSVLCT